MLGMSNETQRQHSFYKFLLHFILDKEELSFFAISHPSLDQHINMTVLCKNHITCRQLS